MLDQTRQKFVESTVRGNGPKQAAIDAGLSPKTATASGSRMRKDPLVVAALAAIGFDTPGYVAPEHRATPKASEKPDALENEEDPELEDPLPETTDSNTFLEAVLAHPRMPLGRRMEAAKLLQPYQHAKIGEKGKKESKADGAKELAEGRNAYGSRKPPKLSAVPN